MVNAGIRTSYLYPEREGGRDDYGREERYRL
jgi:hypothetical protein